DARPTSGRAMGDDEPVDAVTAAVEQTNSREMTRDPNLAAMIERRRAVVIAGHRGDVAHLRAIGVDPDPSVRAAVLGALVRAGAITVDDLEEGLADPEPSVRRRTLELIAHLRASGSDVDVA